MPLTCYWFNMSAVALSFGGVFSEKCSASDNMGKTRKQADGWMSRFNASVFSPKANLCFRNSRLKIGNVARVVGLESVQHILLRPSVTDLLFSFYIFGLFGATLLSPVVVERGHPDLSSDISCVWLA